MDFVPRRDAALNLDARTRMQKPDG